MNKWLFTILRTALDLASPEIIKGIKEGVDAMVTRAKSTPNPWDDVITGLLQMIVGKPGEKPLDGDSEIS